jgi:hypothetical protein
MPAFGKWSEKGVPHSGWTCVEPVEDLGKPSAICEMCEHQRIRYVHRMQHPVYPQVLSVGCDCAGRMEGDPEAALERERLARSRTARLRRSEKRREAFATREWKRSANGNETAVYLGYRITVYPKGRGWGVTVSRDDFLKHGTGTYDRPKDAKERAMRFIEARADS